MIGLHCNIERNCRLIDVKTLKFKKYNFITKLGRVIKNGECFYHQIIITNAYFVKVILTFRINTALRL